MAAKRGSVEGCEEQIQNRSIPGHVLGCCCDRNSLFCNGRVSESRHRDSQAPTPIPEDEQRAALEALARITNAPTVRRSGDSPQSQSEAVKLESMLAEAQSLITSSLSRGWLLPGSRENLEEATCLLDEADHHIRAESTTLQARRGGLLETRPMEALLETRPMDRWLLQNFTAADLEAADFEAAEGHHSATPSGSRQRRLHTEAPLDESLADALRDPEAEKLLERSGFVDFDTLSFSALPIVRLRPLQALGSHTLDRRGLVRTLCDQGQVQEASHFQRCLVRFLGEIEGLYREDVPYHNAVHAADVMMTMEWFLSTAYVSQHVSPLDHLMALVASAVHDVGHPGMNNNYLAKTMSVEAIRYNDKSILENMHVALSFQTMQGDAACNWFALLSQRGDGEPGAPAVSAQHYVRRGLIDMVLGTDMARHSEHVRHLQDFLQEQAEGEGPGASASKRGSVSDHARKQEALDRKLFLLATTLHAADISNPCKPRDSMLRWTQRILDEFWAQGDEELARGMDISPLCDRESDRRAVAKGQLGFINFVIQPLYGPLAKLIPEAQAAADLLGQNRAFWEDIDRRDMLPEEIFSL